MPAPASAQAPSDNGRSNRRPRRPVLAYRGAGNSPPSRRGPAREEGTNREESPTPSARASCPDSVSHSLRDELRAGQLSIALEMLQRLGGAGELLRQPRDVEVGVRVFGIQ